MDRFTGGCLCGNLRIVASGLPYRVGLCHCLDCRKHHGALFHASAVFPQDAVTIDGETRDYAGRFFCPRCGSSVFGRSADEIEVNQLCWALDGALRLRPASGSAWREAAGFFIAPDQPHELDAGAVHVALLYLDAQSAEYAAYIGTSGCSNVDIAELPPLPETSPLRQLMACGGTCAQADEAAQVILGLPAHVGSSPIDPRVARALRWIDGNLQGPIRITRVAEVAGLSESHFAHLFVKMTGVPVRRYVLWRRLGAAVAAATRGASLTEAAYAAGLADSSHLSRAFRSTFGLAPSFLFEHRALLDGQFCV